MKYLVASDFHGSAQAAKEVVKKFEEKGCDKLLLLGDILYHGPRNPFPDEYNPKEVAEVLNAVSDKIIAVKGNCDAEVDQMVLSFVLNDSVQLDINGKSILCTHGQHINAEKPAKVSAGSVVIHGHTHNIKRDEVDGVTYINIGSCALPKHETKKCYGILDEKGIAILGFDDEVFARFDF